MDFFTKEEFLSEYPEYSNYDITKRYINASCEMIYSQIGLRYRDSTWNCNTVPNPIKLASMEQLIFLLEHDIPFVDFNKTIKAGEMSSDLKSDYSTYALRILANHGYTYRGSTINQNMSIDIPFGE